MPVYDKNNNLIEHILDAAGNEIDIQRIHASPHIVLVKIPKLIKPADDYSVALRSDYYYHDFPVLSNNVNSWLNLRTKFINATANFSQALADNVAYNCAHVYNVGTYNPKYIYVGSNFSSTNRKGCEPWYRSYTYDYAISPYAHSRRRSDEQTLACGRIPGDNFNPWYRDVTSSSLVNIIKSQAINNSTYSELGIQVNNFDINGRLGILTQTDSQSMWDNFGALVYGTLGGTLSPQNNAYKSYSGTNNAVAQYIMYFDAEYNKYMFFNIHTLRRSDKILATNYTGVSYDMSFTEYIPVDVTKPFYFILDEQAYNHYIYSNNVIRNRYRAVSDTFDTLIRCRIPNGSSTSTTYSKTSLDINNITSANMGGGHMHVLAVDLYKDRFLVEGWKYPNNQIFVGVHPSDDIFLFNEFNVVSTGEPAENYYYNNSPAIEATRTLSGTSGSTIATNPPLMSFARMWLDFEAI